VDRYWPSIFVLFLMFVAYLRFRARHTRPVGWIQVKMAAFTIVGICVVGYILHSPNGGWLRKIFHADPRSETQIRVASKP
jgi:hypothetical protein